MIFMKLFSVKFSVKEKQNNSYCNRHLFKIFAIREKTRVVIKCC